MNILKWILPAGHIYKIPDEEMLTERNSVLTRNLLKRNAEGNVLLGMGKIITQKDKDKDRENISI